MALRLILPLNWTLRRTGVVHGWPASLGSQLTGEPDSEAGHSATKTMRPIDSQLSSTDATRRTQKDYDAQSESARRRAKRNRARAARSSSRGADAQTRSRRRRRKRTISPRSACMFPSMSPMAARSSRQSRCRPPPAKPAPTSTTQARQIGARAAAYATRRRRSSQTSLNSQLRMSCRSSAARSRPSSTKGEGDYRPGPWHLPVTGGWLPADVGDSMNWWQLGYDPVRRIGAARRWSRPASRPMRRPSRCARAITGG